MPGDTTGGSSTQSRNAPCPWFNPFWTRHPTTHTIIVPSILPLTVEVELLFWALTEDPELGQETRKVKQANMLLSGVRWLSKRLQRRISSDKLLLSGAVLSFGFLQRLCPPFSDNWLVAVPAKQHSLFRQEKIVISMYASNCLWFCLLDFNGWECLPLASNVSRATRMLSVIRKAEP